MSRPPYPEKPIRATLVMFAMMACVCTPILLCVAELRDAWALGLGYYFLLSVTSTGVARHGEKMLQRFAMLTAIVILPACVGFAIMCVRFALLDAEAFFDFSITLWIDCTLVLFGLLAVYTAFLVVQGWAMYYRNWRLGRVSSANATK